MGLTEKQVRNGVPATPGGTGGNVGKPGPADGVAPLQHAAENYGNSHQETGQQIWSGGAPENGIVVVDWDSGLAVSEQPGEQ